MKALKKIMVVEKSANSGSLMMVRVSPTWIKKENGKACEQLAWWCRNGELALAVTTETRYYLLSFAREVQRFATSIRSHWGIGAIRFAETNEQFGDGEQGGEKLLDN